MSNSNSPVAGSQLSTRMFLYTLIAAILGGVITSMVILRLYPNNQNSQDTNQEKQQTQKQSVSPMNSPTSQPPKTKVLTFILEDKVAGNKFTYSIEVPQSASLSIAKDATRATITFAKKLRLC